MSDWTPAQIQIAAVLVALFLAAACMATLAIITTAEWVVNVLLYTRAVWDKTFQAAITRAAAADRIKAECDREIAELLNENGRLKASMVDLQHDYEQATTSLREAHQRLTEYRLFYRRDAYVQEDHEQRPP